MDGRIQSVVVIRVSATGITSSQFFTFSPGTLAWAQAHGHDRVDYPEITLSKGASSDDIYAQIHQTIWGARNPDSTMVVIGVPGPVYQGAIQFAPTIPGLTGDLRGFLVSKGMASDRIAVFNNTDLAANASLYHPQGAVRRHNLRSALLVSLGSGIGSAWILDGRVRLGDGGFAGELGHVVIHPDGPQCVCGHRGCLELYFSGRALIWFAGEKNKCIVSNEWVIITSIIGVWRSW